MTYDREASPDLISSTDVYANRFSGPVGAWLLDRQSKVVSGLMAPWPHASVLDVGGGHAQLSPMLMSAGHDLTTLVSSSQAAQRLLRVTGGKARVLTGDLSCAGLAADSFDVVVAVRMMAHMPDQRAFLQGLCRIARHAVIVDFPTNAGFNALTPLLFHAKKLIEKDTRRYRNISCATVAGIMSENGFRADARVGEFVLPMVLHRMFKRPSMSKGLEGLASPLSKYIGNPVIMRARRVGPA